MVLQILPSQNIMVTIDMDYKFPIEILIEMAGSGYTLGGYIDRVPFEGRDIKAKLIKI